MLWFRLCNILKVLTGESMKAKIVGILSAVTASICCVGPIVLIALGLGGLGLGAAIGKYHWYFLLAAIVLLIFGWRTYFKEKKECDAERCEMKGKAITRNVLIAASTIVLVFTAINVYTYAFGGAKELTSEQGTQVSIPVKGMTCAACEVAIQTALKKHPGVYEVIASAKNETVQVAYDPAEISLEDMINVVNQTGYEATKPQGEGKLHHEKD